MQLHIDLTGREVLITGSDAASRQAVRRYQAAGAIVSRLSSPKGSAQDGTLPERPFLVAAVDDGQPGWDALLERCRQTGIPVAPEPAAGPAGHVTLVGGGPGTAELLTVAAVKALRDADVVFYDRLAPYQELPALSTAELVDVGKRPGHHPVSQSGIEALMVEAALAGRNVVRLKGGDPYVFGRGGEELAHCRAAGVQVEVVPGVTSAFAAPAAAGIPVTHRGLSRQVTVVSGHEDSDWPALAALDGTLVFLMGVAALPRIAHGLITHGLDPDTPAAVVERGCRADQRTTRAPLRSIAEVAAQRQVAAPAVVVVGAVAGLA